MQHLAQDQRCQICVHVQSGISNQQRIAKAVGISQSTVSRELKRNSETNGYNDTWAQQKTAITCTISLISDSRALFLCNQMRFLDTLTHTFYNEQE